MFFARIFDTTGKDDGLQGTVVDVWEADDRAALDAMVGADVAWQFVATDRLDIRDWRYENGAFIDPDQN